MTATYTDAQLITFYHAQRARVEAFGISNLQVGSPRLYKQGRKLVESQAAAKVAEAKAKSRATRWTAEEYDVMAQAYINNAGDRPAILREFRAYSERHTDSAIDMMAQICLQADTTIKSADGLNHPAQGLLDALNAIEPKRFKGTR